jgi:streptothricin acetyltransferase
MRILPIDAAQAQAFDSAENEFEVRECYDLSLEQGEWGLQVRVVEPYLKRYEGVPDDDEEAESFGLFEGDELLGLLVLSEAWNDLASLDQLLVARHRRGGGLAARLLDFAKAWARERGLRGVRLETQSNNVPACRLYRRHGFVLGGADRLAYHADPALAHEIALYWYWFGD